MFGVEQVRLVQDEDDAPASFVFFGGERFGGLGDERGPVKARGAAEGGDDRGVDAAGPDGGVAEVDDRVAAGVETGERGAHSDGSCRRRPRR